MCEVTGGYKMLDVIGIALGIVSIVVTVISIIVTLISIKQDDCTDKKDIKKATAQAKVKVAFLINFAIVN